MCHKLLILYASLMDFVIRRLITFNIMLIEIMTDLLFSLLLGAILEIKANNS